MGVPSGDEETPVSEQSRRRWSELRREIVVSGSCADLDGQSLRSLVELIISRAPRLHVSE